MASKHPQDQQLWADILATLHPFLSHWVRARRQKDQPRALTISEWLQIHALFQHWYTTRNFPRDRLAYGRCLASLVCKSPTEQEDFQKAWQAFRPPNERQEESSEERKLQEAETSSTKRGNLIPLQKTRFDQGNRHLAKLRQIAVAAVVILSVSMGVWKYFPPQHTPDLTNPQPSSEVTASIPSGGNVEPREERPIPLIQSVPLRRPAPHISLSEEAIANLADEKWWDQFLWWSLGLAVGSVVFLWMRRKIIFKQLEGLQRGLDPEVVKFGAAHSGAVLSPSHRKEVAALRFRAAGWRINWSQTIRRTAQSAGFPELWYQPRQRQAHYIVVGDARHDHDQAAWLQESVTAESQDVGLQLSYYDFDRHPEIIWPRGQVSEQAMSLSQLRHRHPDGRLLILVEPDMLFYRLTGGLQEWVLKLKDWPVYVLGLLETPSPLKQQLLQQEGIPWLPIDSVKAINDALAGQKSTTITASEHASWGFPSRYTSDTYLWDPDDTQQEEVLTTLGRMLNKEGLRLLSGMAMYPIVHNKLTFALYRELGVTEEALFRVVNLPWCRKGWLPPWLRERLLDHVDRVDSDCYKKLHEFYLRLFFTDQQSTTEGTIDSGLRRLPKNWKRWVTWAIRWANPGEGHRDAIFARVLLSPRWKPQLSLPGRLLERVLPRQVVERIPAQVTVGLLVPLIVGLCWAGWIGLTQIPQVEAWLAQDRMMAVWSQHGEHVVTLHYHPEAQSLVKSIAKGLQAVGFQVAWKPNEEVQENRIDAPLNIGPDIVEIVKYMSWGRDYPLYKADKSQVLLAKPLQAGQVFRDVPPGKVQKESPYPDGYPDQVREATGSDLVAERQLEEERAEARSNRKAVPPKMIRIPAGTFLMGSPKTEEGHFRDEGPQHPVTVPAFEMGETEVTFAEWDRCAEAEACKRADDRGWGRGRRPVINVSWNDAQQYIGWLNNHLGLSGATAYRLPSEAEWEYAARSGDRQEVWAGTSDERQLEKYAVYDRKLSEGPDEVKSKLSNTFGLYDMSGNMWEWVQDCYVESYEGAPTDGSAREATVGEVCERRSLRGGGWAENLLGLRSADHSRLQPVEASSDTGFRLARTLAP